MFIKAQSSPATSPISLDLHHKRHEVVRSTNFKFGIMDRKTFIQKTTMGIILGIPAVTMLSCSGSDDNGNTTPDPDPDPTPTANCVENGTSISVSSEQNHTHSLSVSKEDVAAGTTKTYDLSQSADHIHQVTLEASDFQALKDSPAQSITKASTTNSDHSHNVTISCA